MDTTKALILVQISSYIATWFKYYTGEHDDHIVTQLLD